MRVAWTRTVEPTAGNEPVTLVEAKAHLKQTLTVDDTYISSLIVAARNFAEEYLSRGLYTQTWKFMQDRWSDDLWLPRAAPLQSVSAVKYYDDTGAQQTVPTTTYFVDSSSEPGRILRAPQQFWPVLQANRALAVEVTYVVGWSAVADIPQAIKIGLQFLIGRWYMDREAMTKEGVPRDVEALWAPYRIYWRPPCEPSQPRAAAGW
jgi:uncharacterized phiE125 gp8 family phage protein